MVVYGQERVRGDGGDRMGAGGGRRGVARWLVRMTGCSLVPGLCPLVPGPWPLVPGPRIENGRNLVELSIVSRLCLVETVSKSNPPPQFGVNRVLGSTPVPVSPLKGGGNRFIELGMGWRRFRCTRAGD